MAPSAAAGCCQKGATLKAENLVETAIAEVHVLQRDSLEHGLARVDVLAVPAHGQLDHLGRAVDRGDHSRRQPLADQRDRDALAAADLEQAVGRADLQRVDRPDEPLRCLARHTSAIAPRSHLGLRDRRLSRRPRRRIESAGSRSRLVSTDADTASRSLLLRRRLDQTMPVRRRSSNRITAWPSARSRRSRRATRHRRGEAERVVGDLTWSCLRRRSRGQHLRVALRERRARVLASGDKVRQHRFAGAYGVEDFAE